MTLRQRKHPPHHQCDFRGFTLVCRPVRNRLPECWPLVNLVFALEIEKRMDDILESSADPKAAATEWLKKNPDAITPWLKT